MFACLADYICDAGVGGVWCWFPTLAPSLVEGSSPHLSTDQMEDWTTAEAGLFEEAMERYGKGFNDIWTDFLPWKTVKNIVEYYYMWKTTDRYVQQKRVKAVESEHKLKQVYVPDYAKLGDGALAASACVGAVCLCCRTTSAAAWYEMPGAELAGLPQCRICQVCWLAYRKYSAMTPGGMSKDLGLKFAGQTKGKKATTLFLQPTLLARWDRGVVLMIVMIMVITLTSMPLTLLRRVARKLPRCKVLSMRRLGRKPFILIDQVTLQNLEILEIRNPWKSLEILENQKSLENTDEP